jgi:MOSC domain-containing protein YiiM
MKPGKSAGLNVPIVKCFHYSSPPMQLHSLHVGKPQTIPSGGSLDWWDKEWTTALVKESVEEPVWLGYEGLRGDGCADLAVHGGVDRAVCVYPAEHYPYWRESLQLPELPFGAFGENFTTTGFDEGSVFVGDIYSLGETLVQLSQPRQPCWKPARRWKIKDLTARIEQTGRTGFYFRVLRHGHVQMGQPFELVERASSAWSVARCNEVMYRRKDDREATLDLSQFSVLSGSWKDSLYARVRSLENRQK